MLLKPSPSQPLKKRFQELYQDRILNLESSCFQFKMKDVLAKLAFEKNEPEFTGIAHHIDSFIEIRAQIEQLSRHQLESGVFVHDLSGIGLYTLAPIIANLWAKGEILKNYDPVIILPYEELKSRKDAASRLSSYFSCWDLELKSFDLSKTLIIIDGYSGKRCQDEKDKKHEDDAEVKALKDLFIDEFNQSQISFLLISNTVPNPFFKPGNVLTLSLRPIYLSVTHLKGRQQASKYFMSSQFIRSQAEKAMKHKFSNKEIPEVLKYQQKFGDLSRRYLEGEDAGILNLQVKHINNVVDHCHLLECYFNIFTKTNEEGPTPNRFKTVEEFYCAAVTAQLTSQDETKKKKGQDLKFYWIGNFLIVRNMQNNYCAVVDESTLFNAETIRDFLSKVPEQKNEEREKFIEFLGEMCACQNLSHENVLEEIQKKMIEFKKKEKDNFPGAEQFMKRLISFFKSSQLEKHGKYFHKDYNRKWAYHEIQSQLNNEIGPYEFSSITQVAREILQGKESDMLDFSLGLIAIFFAETKRYSLNFLVTLCLLDVIESKPEDKKTKPEPNEEEKTEPKPNQELLLWKQFYAHPKHLEMIKKKPESIEEKIIKNIVSALGGLHAMSQGNSYHQTNNLQLINHQDKYIRKNVQPIFGLHWVDFKSSLILMKWLEVHINQHKDINSHLETEIVLIPDTNRQVFHIGEEIEHKNVMQANSYVAHRLVTRLESFQFLLGKTESIREKLPNNYLEMFEYIINSKELINLALPLETLEKEGLEGRPFASLSIVTRLHVALINLNKARGISQEFSAKWDTEEANIDDPLSKCLAQKVPFQGKASFSAINNKEAAEKMEEAQNLYFAVFLQLDYLLKVDPDFHQVYLLLTKFYLEVNQDKLAKRIIDLFLSIVNAQLAKAMTKDEDWEKVLSLFYKVYDEFSHNDEIIRKFHQRMLANPESEFDQAQDFSQIYGSLDKYSNFKTRQGKPAKPVIQELESRLKKELNKELKDYHQIFLILTRFFLQIKQDKLNKKIFGEFLSRVNVKIGDLYSIGHYYSLYCKAKLGQAEDFNKQFEEYTVYYGLNEIMCKNLQIIADDDYCRVFGLRGLVDYKQREIDSEMFWHLEYCVNNFREEQGEIVRTLSQQILRKIPYIKPRRQPEDYIYLHPKKFRKS